MRGTKRLRTQERIKELESTIDDLKARIAARDASQNDFEKFCHPCFLFKSRGLGQWYYCEIGNCKKDAHTCTWKEVKSCLNHGLEIEFMHSDKTTTSIECYDYTWDSSNKSCFQVRQDTQMLRAIKRESVPYPSLFTGLKFWTNIAQGHKLTPSKIEQSEVWDYFSSCYVRGLQNSRGPPPRHVSTELFVNQEQFYIFNNHIRKNWGNVKEVVLAFHGYCGADIKKIMHDSLSFYYSEKGCFSRGIYFSENPVLCDQSYTIEKKDGTRGILLCAVAIGSREMKTTQSWDRDKRCEMEGKVIPSVFFDLQGSTAFVVPSDRQVYVLGHIAYTIPKSTPDSP